MSDSGSIDFQHVAILDIAVEAGKALEAELNATYGAGKAKFFKCDVTDDDQLFNGFNVTLSEQGYIDVVINNAGFMNDSKRLYKKEIELNVVSTYILVHLPRPARALAKIWI